MNEIPVCLTDTHQQTSSNRRFMVFVSLCKQNAVEAASFYVYYRDVIMDL